MTCQHRAQARATRRRRRLDGRGPARRHWNRRRDQIANSAPELRNRPIAASTEDALIGGTHAPGTTIKLNGDGERVSGRRALQGVLGS